MNSPIGCVRPASHRHVPRWPGLRRRWARAESRGRLLWAPTTRAASGPTTVPRGRCKSGRFAAYASRTFVRRGLAASRTRSPSTPGLHASAELRARLGIHSDVRRTSRQATSNPRLPDHSYCTPHGRQRYGGAKRQELRAALVAFITISICDDRTRAVMGDKAKKASARELRTSSSAVEDMLTPLRFIEFAT